MKQPIKVVMLPTEESIIYIERGRLEYHYPIPLLDDTYIKPQHLYITVSQDVESIKEGDWFIHHGRVDKVDRLNWLDDERGNELWFGGRQTSVEGRFCNKIIATTDPKIYADYSTPGTTFVPQVQQSFLEEYVANPNGKWEVEYEVNHNCTVNEGKHPCLTDMKLCDINGCKTWYTLKLNQDNTINITSVEKKTSCCGKAHMYGSECQENCEHRPVEEKMYNREDVEDLLCKYAHAHGGFHAVKFDDWIKENL